MGLSDLFGRRTVLQVIGQGGEDEALKFLLRQGLVLQERNFRCKGGEIDLIMKDRDTLVFIEVRKRAASRFGGAADSVTTAKQRRLIFAAQVFLSRYKMPPPCRFDVVAIDGSEINWLKDAISA